MPENAVLIDERLEASPLGSILQEYVVSDFKLSMWIPSELAGRVIGKKGVVITNLQRETKAKLINALPPVGDTLWIAVVIIGTMKSIIAACEAISDMVDGEVDDVVLEFTINYRKPFFLSGGSKFGILKRISADTQIRIFFPEFDAKETAYNQAQPVTLEGTCENAQKAVRMFEREALVFQQLQEDDVAQRGRVSQVAHTAAHSPASTTTAAVREGRKDGKTNSHDDATAITKALLGTRAEVSAVSNAVTEDSCPKPKKETVEKIVAIPSNLVGLLMSKRPPIKKTIINTIQKYTHTSISKMAPVVVGGVSSEGAVTAAVRDPGGVMLEEEGSVETAAIGRVDGSNAGGDDNSDGGGSGDESDDDDLSGAQTASQGRSRSSSDSSSSCGSQARNRRRRRCAGAASDEEDEEEEDDDDDDDDDDLDEVDADDDSDDGGDDNDEEENEDFAGAGDAAAAEAEQFAMSAEDSIEPVCIETSHPTNLTGESAKGVAADILETLVTAAIAASPSGHAAATTSRNSSSTAANGDEVEPVLFYVRGTLQENVDAVVKSIQQIVDGVRINEVLRALRERSIAFGKSSIHHAKKSANKKRTVKGASDDVAKRKSAEKKQRKDLAKDGDGDHAAAVGEAAGEAAVGKRKSFRGGRKSREQEQRTLEHKRRGGGNATGGVVGASIAGEKAYAAKLSHRRGGAPAARKRSGGRAPPPTPLRSQGTATASGAGSAAAEWSRGGRATTTATATAVVSIDKKKTAEAAASSAPVSGGAPSMGTFVKRTST